MTKGATKNAWFDANAFANYLIAQNGDPKKEQVAFVQSYFAIQTCI